MEALSYDYSKSFATNFAITIISKAVNRQYAVKHEESVKLALKLLGEKDINKVYFNLIKL